MVSHNYKLEDIMQDLHIYQVKTKDKKVIPIMVKIPKFRPLPWHCIIKTNTKYSLGFAQFMS